MKIHSILSAALFLLILPTYGMSQQEKFRNKDLSVEERVNDLLSQMTLEEKINLIGGTGFATKPIERLGIPELRMTDGPLGVRWEKSTAFPSGICIGATWNPALSHKVGAAIGRDIAFRVANLCAVNEAARVFTISGHAEHAACIACLAIINRTVSANLDFA